MKRALISVSDKAGIVECAQELKKLGWDNNFHITGQANQSEMELPLNI